MYVESPPRPALAERVACLWTQEAEAPLVQRVVPDGCVDLIWAPDGPHVAGPDTGPYLAELPVGEPFTGLRFKPGGVGELFGVPVAWLRDRRVPVADLPGVEVRGPDDLQRAVERLLRGTPGPDAGAGAIAGALRRGRAVGDLAWDLGLSERQLNRRCVRAFGYGPKTLQRVVRFQRALRVARSGARLADVAATSGYADQAHMARDVRRLAGVSMGRLLEPYA
ncbi:AraC family transcriptional regulator [Sphaerisporangium siamense]|uniref:AraC-like DNA-binding protein n=1 Tax=Sphaerisporangium siamense TaxID=795645 RepID=A0A7W7DET8_9ACTN|nr:helix-turn-helix transcriptional regulator [Sphaerisporangium siamense]MBB4705492.1 AraC-like DNA-binding protein [Sphaerisporangium siamense]GII83130.1 AraC family transcriptional regulator [Sphaerisporangium siamense]